MNCAGALGEFLLPALRFLGLGQDVDVPAGELRGEADVLAAPADRQRQLIVGDDDLDARSKSSSSTTFITSAGCSALTMKVAASATRG